MSQVVLVHGLWMTGMEMSWLGRRLSACGFQPHRFRYTDIRRSPAENANRLNDWLRGLSGTEIHFVAHSLGGIVLLHLFNQNLPELRPGRVVFLGSPVRGSRVAERLAGHYGLARLLGKSIDQGLLGGAPAWDASRPLGIVSGNLSVGLGQVLGGLDHPHDGTVAEAETRLPGITQHIRLPVSHFGLLTSRRVSQEVCGFLKTGRFSPSAESVDKGYL